MIIDNLMEKLSTPLPVSGITKILFVLVILVQFAFIGCLEERVRTTESEILSTCYPWNISVLGPRPNHIPKNR
jgi:hypothetical protein